MQPCFVPCLLVVVFESINTLKLTRVHWEAKVFVREEISVEIYKTPGESVKPISKH